MPTGDSVAYVAGSTPIPVPHADDLTYRKAHTPPPPKPKGLDWDALKQTCDVCGQKASDVLDGTCGRCRKGIPTATPTPTADAVDVDEDLGGWTINRIPGMRITKNVTATAPGCPNAPHPTRHCACHVFTTTDEARDYIDAQLLGLDVDEDQGPETVVTPYADTYTVLDEHDVAARFTAPSRSLQADLDDLENTDSKVAAAAASYDDMATRVTHPEDHARPPAPLVRAKVAQAQPGPGVLIALSGPVTTTQVSALLADLLAALNTQTPGAGVNATNPPSASGPVGTKDAHQAEAPFSSAGAPAPAPAPTSGGGDRKGKPAPPPGFTAFQRRARKDKIHLPGREVAHAYQNGATLAELAATYGCSTPTIARTLDEQGIERRRKGIPDTHLDQVRSLYTDQGLTLEQVAERVGYSAKAVTTFLNRHGIPIRPSAAALSKQGIGRPQKLQPDTQEQIVARYRAGEPVSNLTADYGVSNAAIYHVLDKHRVPRHGHRPPGGHDGAAGLKAELRLIDATSREIKAWALEQGLIDHIPRGIPARRLVDAYASAHPAPGEPP